MDEYRELLRTIDLLYASALDQEGWTPALRALGTFMQGAGTFYLSADRVTGSVLEAAGAGTDPAIHTDYVDHFASKDVQIPPALAIPVGRLMTEDTLLENGAFHRSEIFHDFYARHDIPYRMVVWVDKTPSSLTAVSIQRSKQQGRFQGSDFERYSLVIPHLLRAWRVRQSLQSIRQQDRLRFEAMNRLPFGVVLLDDSGSIIEMTSAAHRLVRAGQAIACRHRRIRAIDPDADRSLSGAIRRTIAARDDATIPGDTVTIRRVDRGLPLSVAIIPVRPRELWASLQPACLLMISDPQRSTKPSASAVKAALALTDAEARLAGLIFDGLTLTVAAERLEISVNTCKSQLKSIYAKTGCRSHVDLAKALMMTALGRDRA